MLERLFPSMYHRRLLLLAAGAFLVFAVLALQLVRLTVAQGDHWRQRAERVLATHQLIPTMRGEIYDRRGRVLAHDKPTYDVAVRFDMITGDWAQLQARSAAERAASAGWRDLSDAEQQQRIADELPQFEKQLDELWRTLCAWGDVERDELERRKASVIDRVERIHAAHLSRVRADADDSETIDPAKHPVREQKVGHALLTNIPDAVRASAKRLIAQAEADAPSRGEARISELAAWQGVSIEPSRGRDYPLDTITVLIDRRTLPPPLLPKPGEPAQQQVTVEGVAYQMIGEVRAVWADERNDRPFSSDDLGGYLPDDRVGGRGVEHVFEQVLRGSRGRVTSFIDGSRKAQTTEPQPGKSVAMTIDVRLQARVQALMDPQLGLMRVQWWQQKDLAEQHRWDNTAPELREGERPIIDPARPQLGDPLAGAAVVLDVATGEVLAAVSMPTYSRRQLEEAPDSVWLDHENRPYLNRAIGVPYRPGSTVKPLVFAAAVAEGKFAIGSHIDCTGMLDPKRPTMHRCWIFKQFDATHGPLNGRQAIMRSCNVFFYTLGQRLGARRLVWWYDAFGLGRTLDCGLPDESAGKLPDLSRAGQGEPGFTQGDAIMMGIGQGRVDWTPLQAANAYATIARGGEFLSPTFIRDESRRALDPTWQRRREDLHLPKAAIDQALAGLLDVVNDPEGTGHRLAALPGRPPIFDIEGVKVFGKSGTATTEPLRQPIDHDGDGYPDAYGKILRIGDHAWFVGLVQKKGSPRPDYAFAVIVEHGGSGGMTAGPVANQILHAMRAEGYF